MAEPRALQAIVKWTVILLYLFYNFMSTYRVRRYLKLRALLLSDSQMSVIIKLTLLHCYNTRQVYIVRLFSVNKAE